MFIALRILAITLKLILASLLIFLGYLFYQFNFVDVSEVNLGPVSVANVDNTYKLVINQQEKSMVKTIADKFNMFIYQKAEEHNPAGDLLPDQIDDTLRDKIKERIN